MSDLPDWWYAPPISPTERIRLQGLPAGSPSAILGSAPQYDPKAHYERVKAFHDLYPLRTEEECHELTVKFMKAVIRKADNKLPTETLLEFMYGSFYEILEDEGIFEPVLLSYDTGHSAYYVNQIYRPYLVEAEAFYANRHLVLPKIEETFTKFLGAVFSLLPASAFDQKEATTTLPLIQSVPDPKRVIGDLVAYFVNAADGSTSSNRLFYRLRDKLIKNVQLASGIDPQHDRGKKPFRLAYDHDGSPVEAAYTYLRDTPFLDLMLAPIPWSLDQETRFSGHWIISPQGRGKTNLLHSLFVEDIGRDASIILMDSKGDLISPIREMKELKDRLIIVEPDPDHPLALNPLDIPGTTHAKTLDLLEYIFGSLLKAEFTSLQKTLLRNLLPAIITNVPNPTLEIFRDIVERGLGPYEEHFRSLPPLSRRFFDHQFNSDTYFKTRQQLVWRLDFLMTNDLIRAMFNSPTTKFNIGEQMDAGKIILISNTKERLGEEGAEFFGRFFIALVLAAAQQRSTRQPHEKLPCFFYIDECHTVISSDERITTILDECRSQKIALIMAHQRIHQITSKNVLSALMNCAIRMGNADDDASALEDSFRMKADALRSMGVGQFAVWTREMRNNPAVILDIPHIKLHERAKLLPDEKKKLHDTMRQQFCDPAALSYMPQKQEEKLDQDTVRPQQGTHDRGEPLWDKVK